MKWFMDKEYIEKHLLNYIEFQLKQGYSLDDVKEALLKYGYDKELVDEICTRIDPGVHKPLKRPSKKKLDEDLYMYLQNLLVDYIKKEQDNGYEIDVIEKALINYGHHPSMVKQAKRAIKEGMVIDSVPRIGLPGGLVLFISLAVVLGFIMFLVSATSSSIGIVFLSFCPSLISILLIYVIFQNTNEKKIIQMLPIASVAIAVLLFLGALQISPAIRNVSEPQTIVLLNSLLSFIPTSMICLMTKPKPKKYSVEEIVKESAPSPHAGDKPLK